MSDKDHRRTATHILATANKVVTTERGNQHGGAEDSFAMIAALWQTYLRNTNQQFHEGTGNLSINALDVAHMMTLLKVARAVHGNPLNEDNYVDAAGYQGLAAAIAGVQAPQPTPTAGQATAPAPRREPTEAEVDAAATRELAARLAPAPAVLPKAPVSDRLTRLAEGDL